MRYQIKYLALIFLLVMVQAVSAKSPPPGTGKGDVPANVLLMLDTSGSMGIGVATNAAFQNMADVAVDSQGNFYITEWRYHRVRKFDSAGTFVTSWGTYGYGNGQFRIPNGLVIDSNDNVYVSDSENSRIQKFTSEGKFLLKWGSYGGGNGRFRWPAGMGVDTSDNVYVGDFHNRRIQKFSPTGSYISNFTNNSGPLTVTVDGNNNIYVAEYYGNRVSKYTPSGSGASYSTSWGSYGGSNGQFRRPQAITTDASNNVIVADTSNHRIQVFDSDGTFIRKWGSYGTGDGQFSGPFGVNTDSSGNVYVGDTGNKRVQKFDSSGTYISQIGGKNITRLTEAIKVVKKIVSNSDLNQGANFGLMTWATNANMRVNVSPNGSSEIYDLLTNNSSAVTTGGMTYIHNAMALAQRYMNGSSSPITSSCQRTLLVVISDGQFNGYVSRGLSIAKGLAARTPAVKTFVVGFHYSGSSYYTQLASNGGTSAYSPVYADNPQQLYDALAKIIRAEVGGRMTFSAPVIAFDQTGDDYLLQSSFIYKKEHQWEGSLKKFEIKTDGSIGDEKWDAGDMLKGIATADRNIWTVGAGTPSGINNFTTGNVDYIQGFLYEGAGTDPSDQDREDLINFVRGIDVYGEADNAVYGTERWKLGDIYHSIPYVVGPPSANTTNNQSLSHTEGYYRYKNNYNQFTQGNSCGGGCQSRKKTILVGANDGMLHAFDFENGTEKWGFIPPMILPRLRNMVATKSATSNSIYGVDGSPVVKDIFYDNQWKTVLVGGLGAGGNGIYALDITNISSPSFLFAFSNDPSDKVVHYWNSNGDRDVHGYDIGIQSEYDYSEVGETWAKPQILAMPYKGGTKWVAIFGAGYNSGVNTSYGSAVYVIDLEDGGKVLKKIDLTDNSGGVANSVPAEIKLITPDNTSKATYEGAMAYVADLEGKFWKINLSNTGTLYEKTALFDAEADTKNARYAFHQVTPSVGTDDKLWSYYGTGNWQKLQQTGSLIDNRVYAIKDNLHPLFKTVTISKNSSLKNVSNVNNKVCPSQTDLGWFFKLDQNEKVTGRIAIGGAKVFVPRYMPNSTDICKIGTSKITTHDMLCGKKKETIELGEGIVTGLTYYEGTLYGGLSAIQDQTKVLNPKGGSSSKDKSAFSFRVNASPATPKLGTIKYESWQEMF